MPNTSTEKIYDSLPLEGMDKPMPTATRNYWPNAISRQVMKVWTSFLLKEKSRQRCRVISTRIKKDVRSTEESGQSSRNLMSSVEKLDKKGHCYSDQNEGWIDLEAEISENRSVIQKGPFLKYGLLWFTYCNTSSSVSNLRWWLGGLDPERIYIYNGVRFTCKSRYSNK